MIDLQTIIDRFFYANRREYTRVEGEIAYLDGSDLSRPLTPPLNIRLLTLAIVGVALIIGVIFVNSTVLASIRDAARAEEEVARNLTRPASVETVPNMSELVMRGPDDIKAIFAEKGYNMFDASDASDPDSMVLYRLPEDVSNEEAAAMFAKGVGNLSSVDASKLLNGSWYFVSDRNGSPSVLVRYADFSTAKPTKAVQNAIEKQGFNLESVTESGEDDSGNTYSMGTIEVEGATCSWKVSALPLDDMYSISGLPESACYVGVRITVI